MQMMKKRTNCYIYTRVSTSMQVDGYSLDAQREKLRGYAAYQEMTIVGEYSDEGFSGKNIQGRMEFRRMLEDIQAQKDKVDYVLVFKLSRFGRNAADVLNSLQLMQDYGVNLICVEDGIDSSKESGKLMISVLSAVAEIERENIRAQTMAGREQKAREGKWNGGFAPYGYKLENGLILIAEDEAEVIRIIYDRYVHTSDRISTIAEYLNRNGHTKKLRQNNMLPTFSADFVKAVLDNPIYCGKIAYGRRKTVKRVGTRNETHIVWADDYLIHDGLHEAIVSEEVWQLAQKKRKNTCFAKEKLKDSDHAHILSGILRCPCCGKGLYGNVARGKTKDNKIRYYYYCKNPVKATGHSCGFRFNLEQSKIDSLVASIISAMVTRPEFVEAIREKLGTAVDTSTIEKQIDTLKNSLRLASGIKSHLERQMDTMNPDDPFFDQKIADLQRRYDFQYVRMAEITEELDAANDQLQAMLQEKLTADSIYQLLLVFDQLYGSFTELEKKKFMQAFIEKIELYPEKQPDGNWLKHITFNFPIPTKGGQVTEYPLESREALERPLEKHYPEIDIVTTPDGKPVAMVHCNNCTNDMNAWMGVLEETAALFGAHPQKGELFEKLYRKSLEADQDAGGLVVCNYLAGEGVTHMDEGRPMVLRRPDSRFTLANFMRAQLYATMATLRIGMDILSQEHVAIDRMMGHGGLFKTPGVAQAYMAAACRAPVTCMETAGEGGPYGMAVLAAYSVQRTRGETLDSYLDRRVFASAAAVTLAPDEKTAAGFERYVALFKSALAVEQAAVRHL